MPGGHVDEGAADAGGSDAEVGGNGVWKGCAVWRARAVDEELTTATAEIAELRDYFHRVRSLLKPELRLMDELLEPYEGRCSCFY